MHTHKHRNKSPNHSPYTISLVSTTAEEGGGGRRKEPEMWDATLHKTNNRPLCSRTLVPSQQPLCDRRAGHSQRKFRWGGRRSLLAGTRRNQAPTASRRILPHRQGALLTSSSQIKRPLVVGRAGAGTRGSEVAPTTRRLRPPPPVSPALLQPSRPPEIFYLGPKLCVSIFWIPVAPR